MQACRLEIAFRIPDQPTAALAAGIGRTPSPRLSRPAADAAKKSADAATDNIKSLRAQLRAYLEIRGQRPTRDRNQFVIVLKNVGQTPAKNVRGHLNQQWYTDKRDLDAGFTFPDLDVPAVPHGSLMTFVRDQEQEMFLWP